MNRKYEFAEKLRDLVVERVKNYNINVNIRRECEDTFLMLLPQDNSKLTVCFQVDELYSKWTTNKYTSETIDVMAKNIAKVYEIRGLQQDNSTCFLTDFDAMREVLRLDPITGNKEFLKDKPHIDITDSLSAYFSVHINGCIIPITESIKERCNITNKQLYIAAVQNEKMAMERIHNKQEFNNEQQMDKAEYNTTLEVPSIAYEI